MSDFPRVAVVVPIRLAEGTIRQTLQSLLHQTADFPAEVIAVIAENDPTRSALEGLDHPRLRVAVESARLGVPQLRRIGVARSNAPLVAITEDHCLFPPGWIQTIVRTMEQSGADVCGGPVANGLHSVTGWAQYFTRYSAFMAARPEGPADSLPGNNACYRREVFVEHEASLQSGFWEAEFNAELLRSGRRFRLNPRLAVVQNQRRGTFQYLPLRFRHGRCYGARRAAAAPSKWWKLVARSPLIPLVLLVRIVRAVAKARTAWPQFLVASPLVAAYVLAWSAGETVGYLLGAGCACEETD